MPAYTGNYGQPRMSRRAVLQAQAARAVGGEGGIRTPGTLASTSHFECDAIDHSATSP